MTPADRDLEDRIDTAVLRFHSATTPSQRRAIWADFKRLLAMRTPERVREMEIEKGLRQ
jgi:hypothetical protein